MFNKYFEVILADTEESKKAHYSIRYQVYCEEMGFENKDNFPDQMEHDEYDDSSVHFIVRDKISGQWLGAMRLIYKQDSLLPIEQSCKLKAKIGYSEFSGAVELSRLCLIKEARKGIKDIDPPHGIDANSNLTLDSDKIKSLPQRNKLNRMIIWGLFYAAAEYCSVNNMPHVYFMTTAALARIMRRGGLNLMDIGDSCMHKGERFPFKMNAIETYQNKMWKGYQEGYQVFSKWKVAQIAEAA